MHAGIPAPGKRKDAATKHIALLRGINVGGKNKLPMRELAAIFAAAGCLEVETYIQSGNVVFSAPASVAARLPSEISSAVKQRFGLAVPVILRTCDELAGVLAGNPFLARGAAEEALHVMFLAGVPGPDAVASLDPKRSPGDKFRVEGREIYLHLPNGVAASKLTNAYFDARLGTVGTARNWRTVATLCRMAQKI